MPPQASCGWLRIELPEMIVVHHLKLSRSQRVISLLKELGISRS